MKIKKNAKIRQNTSDDQSGDLLFIPSLWFHIHIERKYAGIAIVNIFWKNLDEERKIPMETKITVPTNKKFRIINHKLKLSSEFDPYTQIDRYTKNIGNQRYRRVFEKVTLC